MALRVPRRRENADPRHDLVRVLALRPRAGGILTKRAADPAKTAFFIRNASWAVMWVFLPASVLVFVSGVGLVESGFWDWDETFIVAGIVLWASVSLIAFGFLGRAMARAGSRLESEGPSPQLMLTIRNLV